MSGEAAPRRRASRLTGLGVSAHEERYAEETSSQCYLRGDRARRDLSGSDALELRRRARKAVAASRAPPAPAPVQTVSVYGAGGYMAAARRAGMPYTFSVIFGSPRRPGAFAATTGGALRARA